MISPVELVAMRAQDNRRSWVQLCEASQKELQSLPSLPTSSPSMLAPALSSAVLEVQS